MVRLATVFRALVVTSLLAGMSHASSVSATGTETGEGGVLVAQMPGARFRAKPKLSVDAVLALTLIMRTENKEDPTYKAARLSVSNAVAKRMNLDPVQLDKAWSRAPRDHQIATLSALTQLGVRYLEGKESPYVNLDCSGLMWIAWRTAGVDLPRQAVSQLDRRMRVDRKDAIMGDIVGEGTHVQIYLGLGLAMIHAPFNGKYVKFKTMSEAQAQRVVWTNPSNIATYRL
jgi:hypothetical protein